MSGFCRRNLLDDATDLCPLNALAPGTRGTIVSLPKDRMNRQRLLSLGISPGKIFEVRHRDAYGPTVLVIDGQRIAIDSTLAEQVSVVAEPSEDRAWSSAMARLKEIWSLR